jgi:hypothetical protein
VTGYSFSAGGRVELLRSERDQSRTVMLCNWSAFDEYRIEERSHDLRNGRCSICEMERALRWFDLDLDSWAGNGCAAALKQARREMRTCPEVVRTMSRRRHRQPA